MRALVTGAAGFVGRHMVAELVRRGWDVARFDIVEGTNAFEAFWTVLDRFDLVVHAAASSPHRAAIDSQAEHFIRNAHLDSAMFEWAMITRQSRVLYLSSCAAYPAELQSAREGPSPLLTEDDIYVDRPLPPIDDYGWAKLTGERLAGAARRAGLPVTVVRPFSGYGTDQSENFPFRAFIERARRREDPFVIWGDGSQVRDWIHIDDVVAGALAVAEGDTDQPVNLCTGIGTSMLELAAMACEQVGYQPEFRPLTDKPAGVAYRVGDPTRFHEFYKPQVTLAEGVARALRV